MTDKEKKALTRQMTDFVQEAYTFFNSEAQRIRASTDENTNPGEEYDAALLGFLESDASRDLLATILFNLLRNKIATFGEDLTFLLGRSFAIGFRTAESFYASQGIGVSLDNFKAPE